MIFLNERFIIFLNIITSLKLTDEIKKKLAKKKIEKLKLATQHQI